MAANECLGKTVMAVSHGGFLAALYCLLTQQKLDETFIPHNNSLMIIDFEPEVITHKNGVE